MHFTTRSLGLSSALHLQTKHMLLGLRQRHPVDNGPQEGDYFAWVALEKGKVETGKTSTGTQTFPFLQANQAE